MGPIGCPETTVRNYHHSLRNHPEERSSHLFRGGSLKSLLVTSSFTLATNTDIASHLMFVVPYILVIYMFNSGPVHCILYFFRRWLYMFRVLFAPIIRSTTAAYSHRFCMVWCVIPLEQVLVWDSFTLKYGQLQLQSVTGQTSTCSNGITHQTTHSLLLYATVVLLMMGANSTRNM
jgi:hypothetical protein